MGAFLHPKEGEAYIRRAEVLLHQEEEGADQRKLNKEEGEFPRAYLPPWSVQLYRMEGAIRRRSRR